MQPSVATAWNPHEPERSSARPIRAALIGNCKERSLVAQLGLHLFHG
jgi:hypothetical protein